MQALVALAEALNAPITSQPDMRNFTPPNLEVGKKGGIWVGFVDNWAPIHCGDTVVKQIDARTFRAGLKVTKYMPGDYDLELTITGKETATMVEHKSGFSCELELSAKPGELNYYCPDHGFSIRQRATQTEVRLWLTNLPGKIKNAALHLAY